MLQGKSTDKISQFNHQQLSTFGIGSDLSTQQWRSLFRQLVARGLLDVDHESYGALRLSERCRALLRGEQTLQLRQDKRSAGRSERGVRVASHQRLSGEQQPLFEALRNLRRQLADSQDVPPFVIFHDATLVEMVEQHPTSLGSLAQVSGVGKAKLERYGDAFVELLRQFDPSTAH